MRLFGGQIDVTLGVSDAIAGAVVSRTVTTNDPLLVLPVRSVAVHDTVVVPIGNRSPDLREHCTFGDGSRLSCAVTVKVATAPAALVASIVTASGFDSTGGVTSNTLAKYVPVSCASVGAVWSFTVTRTHVGVPSSRT